jgi:hypothetical protein
MRGSVEAKMRGSAEVEGERRGWLLDWSLPVQPSSSQDHQRLKRLKVMLRFRPWMLARLIQVSAILITPFTDYTLRITLPRP